MFPSTFCSFWLKKSDVNQTVGDYVTYWVVASLLHSTIEWHPNHICTKHHNCHQCCLVPDLFITLFLLKKKTTKLKKTSSFEDTDTDQESTSSASRAPLHHSKYGFISLTKLCVCKHCHTFLLSVYSIYMWVLLWPLPLVTLQKEEDHEVIQSSVWSGQIHTVCGSLWYRGTRWALLFNLHSLKGVLWLRCTLPL